jgi:hypothetical protein
MKNQGSRVAWKYIHVKHLASLSVALLGEKRRNISQVENLS